MRKVLKILRKHITEKECTSSETSIGGVDYISLINWKLSGVIFINTLQFLACETKKDTNAM
jgi:hypothetical protein